MTLYTNSAEINFQVANGDGVTTENLRFNAPGNNGRCISHYNDNDILIRNIYAENYSKNVVRLRDCNRVHIEDVYGDGMHNFDTSFAIGMIIGKDGISGENDDVTIKNCEMRNHRYPGGSSYWNTDGWAIERNNTNIRFENCVAIDMHDGGFDSKSNCTFNNVYAENMRYGVRCQQNTTQIIANSTFVRCFGGIQVDFSTSFISTWNNTFIDCKNNIELRNGATSAQITELTSDPFAGLEPSYPVGFTQLEKDEYNSRHRQRTKTLVYRNARNIDQIQRMRTSTPVTWGGNMGTISTVTDGISSGTDGEYAQTANLRLATMETTKTNALTWFQNNIDANCRSSVLTRLSNQSSGLIVRLNDNWFGLKESGTLTNYGHMCRDPDDTAAGPDKLGWNWNSDYDKNSGIIHHGPGFNGSNEWMDILLSGLGDAWDEANFSIITQCGFNNAGGGATRAQWELYKSGDANHFHRVYTDTNSLDDFAFSVGDAGGSTDTTRADVTDDEHRSVYVYDRAAGSATLYLNNSKVAEDLTAEDPIGLTHIRIGKGFNSGTSIENRFRNIIILPVALSSTDALAESLDGTTITKQMGIGVL